MADKEKETWRMYYEKNKSKHVESQRRYDKENVAQIRIALNKKYDADIIAYVKLLENKNGYLKQLIRDDIKRTGYDAIVGAPAGAFSNVSGPGAVSNVPAPCVTDDEAVSNTPDED